MQRAVEVTRQATASVAATVDDLRALQAWSFSPRTQSCSRCSRHCRTLSPLQEHPRGLV